MCKWDDGTMEALSMYVVCACLCVTEREQNAEKSNHRYMKCIFSNAVFEWFSTIGFSFLS